MIRVTSTHHQMMIPTDSAIVLGTARESLERNSPNYSEIGLPKFEGKLDTEVVFYDDTNCLCFQPHPEYGRATPELVDFFEECLENFIFPRIPLEPTEKAILDQIPKAIKKIDKKAAAKKEKA